MDADKRRETIGRREEEGNLTTSQDPRRCLA
jgi:hypothetical protein